MVGGVGVGFSLSKSMTIVQWHNMKQYLLLGKVVQLVVYETIRSKLCMCAILDGYMFYTLPWFLP